MLNRSVRVISMLCSYAIRVSKDVKVFVNSDLPCTQLKIFGPNPRARHTRIQSHNNHLRGNQPTLLSPRMSGYLLQPVKKLFEISNLKPP